MDRLRRVAALAALALSLHASQDGRKWAEALAFYRRYSTSRDPLDRARAADELGAATSEKYDSTCWQLVGQLLRKEIGQDGRGEEQVNADVVEACLEALRKVAGRDALSDMLKTARSRTENPRFRMYVLWALGARAEPGGLAEFVDDARQPLLQVAALDALAERADPSSSETFFRVLGDPERTWEAKLAALRGIEKIAEEKHVEPLIDALGRRRPSEGRLKDAILKTLGKLVGTDLPTDDPNAWRAAWAARKAGRDPAGMGADTVAESAEFYGLKTRSTRMVFLIDHTGSMKGPGGQNPAAESKRIPDAAGGPNEPPAEAAAREEATRIRRIWDRKQAATRMDAVRKELIRTVYRLDPRVQFGVIWYEGNAKPWKPELVPAAWSNKLDCIREAERLTPSGTTNIWDALELALRMTETPGKPGAVQIDRRANYATALNGPDTFFLMTDGRPSAGRLSTAAEILSEIRKVNRLRRIVINTVCVGDEAGSAGMPGVDPPDPEFMRRLAEENGGECMHAR